jgi:hypothetical protein
MARNSPARRVPSHGTHAFGVTYAIDFVAVDDGGVPAVRTWRTFLATEPPELFRGFGEPVLAPAAGVVVAAHDGEVDHEARRSQLTLVPYVLGQAGRARRGAAALAGNHVVIATATGGPFVALAHLRRGSLRVRPGDVVRPGDGVGECGNSGNSTQPHVHVQVTDSERFEHARGVPMVFRRSAPGSPSWMPEESEIVTA